MNSINTEKFIKIQKDLINAYRAAVSAAVRHSGYGECEAELLLDVFDGGSIAYNPENSAAEKLVNEKMAEPDADGTLCLTGRGAIAAKSLSQNRQRFFEGAFKNISSEELFIFGSVLEKICRNLA